MKKICSRCSNSFVCREDRTDLCQCTRTYMVPGSKDYIKENFDDCVCSACRKEISSSYNAFGINPKFRANISAE